MSVLDQAIRARAAARLLARASDDQRRGALRGLAAALLRETKALRAANDQDLAAEQDPALRQRLRFDPTRVAEMVRAVAELPDPLGRVSLRRRLDDGLELARVSVPLGVLGAVFEARPDALIQIAVLALRSGNAVLLKGGREAAHSNALLLALVRTSLARAGLPEDAAQALPDREAVQALLELDGLVDLIIPRGSKELVRSVRQATRIPVLGHADGVCHLYVDRAADEGMALRLLRDGKLQYPAACNAVETLLVHAEVAADFLPRLTEELPGIEWRGCPASRARVPTMAPATKADWDAEYNAPILAVKVVADLEEALAHIGRHGSGHTEAIVTGDRAAASRFLAEVDAAGVFHNASTRFADGHRYGFGAEVGISTARIHARGPVGLEGLLTHKYLLEGHGHIVADYAAGKPFLHRDLPP